MLLIWVDLKADFGSGSRCRERPKKSIVVAPAEELCLRLELPWHAVVTHL
jgi:hypothetical protein